MSIFNFFKKSGKSVVDNTTQQPNPVSVSKPEKERTTIKPDTEATDKNVLEEVKRVHNLIILDESGSMQSIYQPALTGVNETLQTIRGARKKHENQTHFVSLIAFNSGHYNQIYCNTPAEKALDITKKQYRPLGGTPLYDAMGRSINELRPNVEKGDVVLVTVITDGYENASREYNGKAIKSLIEEMKKEGWVFTYIGANQDVEAVAESMSIDNRLAFVANDECTKAMFERENRSREKFFRKINGKFIHPDSYAARYFDEDDEDDEDDKESKNKF